jgi:hypothetical protein
MEDGLIPEKMPGRKMVLSVELEAAERLIGIRAHYLGIPIYEVSPYSPPRGPTDGYEGLRKWYRNNIESMGGVCILHRSDLQRSLAKAQPDALEYLVTEDASERAKHEGWLEPGNEAIEIEQWIFPANAVTNSIVASDFNYEIIIVSVIKDGREIDRVYYFVKRKERLLTYSHHFWGQKPARSPHK